MRASHLDPSNELAAYLVAMNVETMYPEEDWLSFYSRMLQEGLRYLDRFGEKCPKHHRDVLMAVDCAGMMASGRLRGERPWQRYNWFAYPPNDYAYAYAALCPRNGGTGLSRPLGHALQQREHVRYLGLPSHQAPDPGLPGR